MTDGRTDERTDERTDGRTRSFIYLRPQISNLTSIWKIQNSGFLHFFVGHFAYFYVFVALLEENCPTSEQKVRNIRNLTFDHNIWLWGQKFKIPAFICFCAWVFCIFLSNFSLVFGKLCDSFAKKEIWYLTSIFDINVKTKNLSFSIFVHGHFAYFNSILAL